MSSELTRHDDSVQLKLDGNGVILETTGDTRTLFGVSPSALSERNCTELVVPGIRSSLRNLLSTALDRPRMSRFRLANANGDLCNALWTLAPAENGQIWCMISAAPPDHAPYDLPPALAEVLDRANHILFFCNPLGHFINLNPALSRITGYSRCELEALNFSELVHSEDRLLARSIFLGALGGSGQQGEIRVLTKDRRQHHIHITNAPLWDKAQIIGVVGVGHDITAERIWSTTLHDTQKRLSEAQRIAGLGRWTFDFKTRRAHWSPELFSLLGMDPRDFSNDYAGFRRLVHRDDVEKVTQHHRDVIRLRQPLDLECRILTPDGTVRWIHERGEVIWSSSNRPIRIEGTLQDITECKRVEEELRLTHNTLSQLSESLFILDASRRVLAANAAFCRLIDCARSAIQDQAPEFLLAPGQNITALDSLWQHLKTIGTWKGFLPGRTANGHPLPLDLSLSAVRDANGYITHYIGLCRESPVSPEKIADAATQSEDRDAITALPNRKALMQELVKCASTTERLSDRLALLWIDLDHFRSINESLDPAAGDEILRKVGQRFRHLEDAPQSRVFHVGGDAFAVVLQTPDATTRATALAESLLEALNRPLTVAGAMLGLSASIGIAVLGTTADDDAADLVRQAETAMYQAKRHRHCYRLASRSRKTIDTSPMSAHELRQAVHDDALFLVYQPIFGQAREQVLSVEALVRWAHPTRGTLAPNSFLPLAERIGLLPALGEKVLDMALRQLALWRRLGSSRLRMAVNIAPAQFANPQLTAQVAEALQRNQLPADALMLEITENALIANPEKALESLRALRSLGVQIAIDDFGMGYSSFNYLKQYPFDALKIDRSFVSALPGSEQDAAIVEAMLSMSRRLQLDVIAEGVETRDQWMFLTDRGCQELQGFWLSRPLSGEALGQLLQNTAGNRHSFP